MSNRGAGVRLLNRQSNVIHTLRDDVIGLGGHRLVYPEMGLQGKNGPDRVLHSIVVVLPKEPQFPRYRGPLDGGDEALRYRWALQPGRLPISDLTVTKVHTIKLRRQSDNYCVLAGRVIPRAAHDNGGAGLAP